MIQHPDVIDNLNWGRNLRVDGLRGFYQRDIPDAGPPNYPPLYYYINLTNQLFYENVKEVLWKINLNVPAFPSNLYLWFESKSGNIFFNKLPAIFADVGISFLIYRIVKEFKDQKRGEMSAALFLFLPPSWYLSAVWGQTDSLYIFFILASFLALVKKKWTELGILYLLSFLIKPTAVIVLPLFIFIYFKNFSFRNFVYTSLLSLFLLTMLAIPFLDEVNIRNILDLYKNNIREVTGYLTANSFNLWSLVYGLSPISDSTKILGIPAFRLGEILYLILTSFVIFKVKVKDHKSILYSFLILSLGAFLILTKMHERYYFLTFIFLALLSGVDKKLRKIYYLCSLLFFINLYHFWWMPKFAFLIDILSQNLVEKLLAILNILLFFSLLKYYVGIPKAINRENLYNKFKWIRNSL
ncbi:MAG: hypothetical protein UT40_C0043G0005 [Candidatus Woesebacteria bacterium GW2011_GWA1_39_21b]|uniref:Glycosyltransferase RgtA/B/C/D-like domain-containing protein n=1 Tax=Candidatus Woesebacteria bacterium GW2011_GWA1_39_21b TaxID=1618551 RepID=A0A0G0RB28_9BACT|nr:MAG: hypothetical protein UT40_C0043G0005 [Candidatus Woesebacteria bacterium GW2011_GWA1_39_21b]